jgi:polar amino acid transport system substrate-binding protein
VRLARVRPVLATAVGIGLLSLVAACGGGDDSASGSGSSSGGSGTTVAIEGIPAVQTDPTLSAGVPDAVKKAGKLTVGTNAPFPPYEMFKSDSDQTIVGLEADLGHAIGNVLGVRFDFVQQPFDGLIPALQSGKQNVIMSTLFDTAKREQVVDMVNYSASGSGILVTTGNPKGIKTSTDLCGKSVAVQTGSAQVAIVEGLSAKCSGGKIAVKALPQYSDELLALTTGQADAVVGDIPAISYSLAEKANAGKFELVTDPAAPNGYESAPVGIALAKGAGLTKPVQGALEKLMADGTYTALLKKWDVPQIAVDKVTVNAASTSGS